MTTPQAHQLEILAKLKALNIVPASTEASEVADDDALLQLIRHHISPSSRLTLYDEEIGTDNDAGEDYVALMKRFSRISGGHLVYENASSTTEGDDDGGYQVKIDFTWNAKPYAWAFGHDSDRISEDFLDAVIAHSRECPAGEFIDLMADEAMMIAFVPRDLAALLHQHELVY